MHETVVIGGGPAGTAAAISLAREGRQVCLLERKQTAHHKICGEFISWEAAQIIENLGVHLPELGAQAVRQVRLFNEEATITAELPFTAWSLSRRRLDSALLQQAEREGVDVRQGVTVRALSKACGGWSVEATGKSSADEHFESGGKATSTALGSGAVFLASGKHDLRNWRRAAEGSRSGDLIGLKMHFRLTPGQQAMLQETVELHLFDGGYAGLELVEEGSANLCFLVSKRIYSACGKQWPSVLQWLEHVSPHMKARLRGAEALWSKPVTVCGVPYGYLHSPVAAQSGLYRLGDQAAVIPSLAGDGIAIALRSGCLAAQVYAEGGSSKSYQSQALAEFRGPVRSAQVLSRLFSGAIGRKAAFSLAGICPGLVSSAISRTRLDVH